MLEYNKIEKLLLSGIWSCFKNQTWYSENGGHFVFFSFGGGALGVNIPLTYFQKHTQIVDENDL